MTMTAKQYWSAHVEAVKAQAITTKAYAQRHGLVLSTLYYWQRRLKPIAAAQANAESMGGAPQPGKFLRLHLQTPEPARHPTPTNCTLIIGSGVRLEMQTLPDPQWLTALARCAHGVC